MPSKPKPKRELCAYTLRTVARQLAAEARHNRRSEERARAAGRETVALCRQTDAYTLEVNVRKLRDAALTIERSKRRGRKA